MPENDRGATLAAASRRGLIFISYARTDATDFARLLVGDLEANGYSVWADWANILPSRLWDVEVEKGIKRASVVAAVLTRRAVEENSVCRDEISCAFDEGKSIVVLRRETDPHIKPPLRLLRSQWIDFSYDYDTGLKQLLRYLAGDESEVHRPILEIVANCDPIDFGLEITHLKAGFAGRRWLVAHVDTWLTSRS